MQTEAEIRETIGKPRAAMDTDGFKPIADGTRLKDHLYYIRLGAIQYLEDVIGVPEEDDEEKYQCPHSGIGCMKAPTCEEKQMCC